jgi:hypothetical protein
VSRFWALKTALGGSGGEQQRPCRLARGSGIVEVGAEKLGGHGDAVVSKCVEVAAPALDSSVNWLAAAEERDPSMAGGEQVLDGVAGAAGVVGQDGVGVEHARRAVEEDERHTGGALAQ